MSFVHSNRSRGVASLASGVLEICRARCPLFRGVRNSTERKESAIRIFRGLAAPIVGIFESTWAAIKLCSTNKVEHVSVLANSPVFNMNENSDNWSLLSFERLNCRLQCKFFSFEPIQIMRMKHDHLEIDSVARGTDSNLLANTVRSGSPRLV